MNHVFISYVRENSRTVERLATDLAGFGITVWLDKTDIGAGQPFKIQIKNAIENGAFFLACFSKQYTDRDSSYVNEEISIAVEIRRKRQHDSNWFIPVLLNKCDLPKIEVSLNTSLSDLQAVKLYHDWGKGIAQLIKAIQPSLSDESLLKVLDRFGRHDYEGAYRLLLDMESRLQDVQLRILNIVLYNLACCESRLAATKTIAKERERFLDRAELHLQRWVAAGVAGAWKELRRSTSNQIEYMTSDDDLFLLLLERGTSIRRALPEELRKEFKPPRHPSGHTGSCIPIGCRVRTPSGDIRVEDLREGAEVVSIDHQGRPCDQIVSRITRIRTSRERRCIQIDRKFMATETQPVYCREKGWCIMRDLRVGMAILRDDGSYLTITSITTLDGYFEVYIFSTDHISHNFIAEGIVCHNMKL